MILDEFEHVDFCEDTAECCLWQTLKSPSILSGAAFVIQASAHFGVNSDSGKRGRWRYQSIPLIAILPFINLTGDRRPDYCSDGIR
jgi:hypothetical protein